MPGYHFVHGHWVTRNGKRFWRSAHYARNRGSGGPGEPPKRRRAVAFVATVAVAAGITVTVTLTSTPGASGTPSSQHEVFHDSGSAEAREAAGPISGLRASMAALVAKGYDSNYLLQVGTDCSTHSYDQVQVFFRKNPCSWFARAYLVITQGKGAVALIAFSWVSMPSAHSALEYKQLVDAPNTGNITELSRDVGPYRSIRYTGKNYISGMIGMTVWNVEVQPVTPLSAAAVAVLTKDSRQ